MKYVPDSRRTNFAEKADDRINMQYPLTAIVSFDLINPRYLLMAIGSAVIGGVILRDPVVILAVVLSCICFICIVSSASDSSETSTRPWVKWIRSTGLLFLHSAVGGTILATLLHIGAWKMFL